jgi:predicted TIM-barrel fold metal-dependent hydrolase
MLIDCHVHTSRKAPSKEAFLKQLDEAGVEKAVLLSWPPGSFALPAGRETDEWGRARASSEVLREVMEWASFSGRITPFFWIDPLDGDAFDQVDRAVEAGIGGFKVICNRFFPGDERPMRVWERIARAGKPMLFHSGILYSPTPASQYNRPLGFEPLLMIPNLRFAMAHVSWPWCDEMLAVYGYWSHLRRNGLTSAELFIDTTPGTPGIYRREVLSKIYTIGYDVENNILFGSDGSNNYNPAYTKHILEMDKEGLDAASVPAEQREKYYAGNALRFLGVN